MKTSRTTASGKGRSTSGTAKKSTSRASSNGRSSANGRSSSSSSRSSASSGSRSSSRSTGSNKHSDDLHKVFVDNLKDIYWAEKHLVRGLTKMARAAENEELKMGFERHREETEQQIEQLEQAFEALELKAQGKRCEAMEGLLREGQEQIEEYEQGPGRDAAMIVAAQKIEHYEIAAYGSLRTFAATLGYPDCEQIFQAILDQEVATDELLTETAMSINQEAMRAGQEAGMEDEEEA